MKNIENTERAFAIVNRVNEQTNCDLDRDYATLLRDIVRREQALAYLTDECACEYDEHARALIPTIVTLLTSAADLLLQCDNFDTLMAK